MSQASVKSGASAHSPGKVDKIRSSLAHHQQTAIQTMVALRRELLGSLLTWLMLGVALALPTILYVLLTNLENIGGEWGGSPRLSLYLADDISVNAGRVFADKLSQEGMVSSAKYLSPTEALREFEAQSGFHDLLASLPDNPLPAVVEMQPHATTSSDIKLLVKQLEAKPEVAQISVDIEWLERLLTILDLSQRFVIALSLFLALGVVLAVGNTIRLAIENRRAEIEIIKLVGATDAFVRRPFLYLGFWLGAGGAFCAWLMVQSCLLFLSSPIEQLLYLYQNSFALQGLSLADSFGLFALGASLGVFGAVLAVGRHLAAIEPK